MSLLKLIYRHRKRNHLLASKQWETYCVFSLAERLDQLSHDQVVLIKSIRGSEYRNEVLASLIYLSTGETLTTPLGFEQAVLQILDALNAMAPHDPGHLKSAFRKLIEEYTHLKNA